MRAFEKNRNIVFVWRQCALVLSEFIMSLGIALCVQSGLGSAAAIPTAMSIAGADGYVPSLSIGTYTFLLNVIFIMTEILILRCDFKKIQLLQLTIGFLFGVLLDISMAFTSLFAFDTIVRQIVAQYLGCTLLGIGIALEIRCNSIMMPGEGLPVSISRVFGISFAKVKIVFDILLVLIAVSIGFIFYKRWMWNVVGPGNLFAMFYVGYVVKCVGPHLGWFDRTLNPNS